MTRLIFITTSPSSKISFPLELTVVRRIFDPSRMQVSSREETKMPIRIFVGNVKVASLSERVASFLVVLNLFKKLLLNLAMPPKGDENSQKEVTFTCHLDIPHRRRIWESNPAKLISIEKYLLLSLRLLSTLGVGVSFTA